MMLLLAFLVAFGLVGGYVTLNIAAASAILHYGPGCARFVSVVLRHAIRCELRAVSASRVWVTAVLCASALMTLFFFLRTELSLIGHVFSLLGYVFVVSALTLSLLARLPIFTRIWSDPAVKVGVLALPPFLAFVAKAYAGVWIGEQLGTSWANVSISLFAGMVLLLCLVPAALLAVCCLAFEVALLFVAMRPVADAAKRRGLWVLTPILFLSTYAGTHAALELVGGRLGNALLLASAFEFDASPALHCNLTQDERDLARGGNPVIKALHLGTSQEKALLVRRSSALFLPVVLAKLKDEPRNARRVDVLRVVSCYELAAPS